MCLVTDKQDVLVDWCRRQQESLRINVVDQGVETLVGMVSRQSICASLRFQCRDRLDKVRQSRLTDQFFVEFRSGLTFGDKK